MELSKQGQTNNQMSQSSPIGSIPIFHSSLPTSWGLNSNTPNYPAPAHITIGPFNVGNSNFAPSNRSPSANKAPPKPEKLPNIQYPVNKKTIQIEVSPKPQLTKSGTRSQSNKRSAPPEPSPKSQSPAAIELVRSKLRESLANSLSTPITDKNQEKTLETQEEAQDESESMVDELLQGNGLCWASESAILESSKRAKTGHEDAKTLASKIESELFRLFGGVNKKYKEKGRSLLFNLKDPSNPELRERVLSGDILPERLCSMSAEELASEELSQWRQAKAEELAQAIVLPDAVMDIRKMFKKTHKGEVQVELEPDLFPLQAEIKASVPRAASRPISTDKPRGVSRIGLDPIMDPDLMQELMVDELGDAMHLSPVVSLDEFMKDLDSEPPFENLPIDDSNEEVMSGVHRDQTSLKEQMKEAKSDRARDEDGAHKTEKDESEAYKAEKDVGEAQEEEKDESGAHKTEKDESGTHKAAKDENSANESVMVRGEESMWQGVFQFNPSSLANVLAFYRSGERPAMKEWPGIIEIKGRVKLDAFEKFLKELPLSRSRALMIAQFCWKEGSLETGRQNLSEIINSYIADERVGIALPNDGVELYLCPTHDKMKEMLNRLLSKEHSDAVRAAASDGLIGIAVWRRPLVNTVSPRMPSQHKHFDSSSTHSTKKHQQQSNNTNTNTNYSRIQRQNMNYNNSKPARSSLPQRNNNNNPANVSKNNDDYDGDVPPGFEHMVNKNRDEDDLPEYDFGSTSDASVQRQMRELVNRYGQGQSQSQSQSSDMRKSDRHHWNNNDDYDDVPEWNPNEINRTQVQLPPQPPHMQTYSITQNMQPLQANQFATPSMPLQPPLRNQMGHMNTQQSYQLSPTPSPNPNPNPNPNSNQWWAQNSGGMMQQPMQKYGGQQYGMGWRPDYQGNMGP